jgi:hypothetical protein
MFSPSRLLSLLLFSLGGMSLAAGKSLPAELHKDIEASLRRLEKPSP